MSAKDEKIVGNIKEDLDLNKKVLKVAEAYTKNLTNLTELLTLVKNFDFPGLKTTIDSLKADVTTQNDHLAKWAESSASMAWSVGPRMTRIENTQGNIKSDLASLKNVKTRRGTAGAVSQKAPICKVVSTGKQYSEFLAQFLDETRHHELMMDPREEEDRDWDGDQLLLWDVDEIDRFERGMGTHSLI
ncbi:hypothetical protein Tco_0078400 [Tanacetum coccineum]